MEYDNLDPLYKILCLALIFLVPLAPAFGLYKIAPADKFLAKGDFSGFKINATGSAAIYIVLFVAIYSQTSVILAGIDSSRVLKNKITSLEKDKPWKIEYTLKLMDQDSVHEIEQTEYAKYVQPDSIICSPRAIHFDIDSKIITFYIDNSLLTSMGDTIKSQLLLRNGYGTTIIPITKKLENTQDRLIKINGVFYKAQSKANQINDINNHRVAVLNKTNSNVTPPVVTSIPQ